MNTPSTDAPRGRASRGRRGGYAMLLVLAFIAAVFSIYSLSHRHVVSLIRTEHARSLARERDAGSLKALADACELLETGLPPNDPWTCGTLINTGTVTQLFVVRFETSGSSEWTIDVRPALTGESPPPMPTTF